MVLDPLRALFARTARSEPLVGDRRETVQRLQVGFFGLGAMILLVGLANIIMNSVQESRASAVPEAAPTVMASESPAPSRDPLADAGVVPDLPPDSDADAAAGPDAMIGAPSAPAPGGGASPQP